MFYCWCLTIDRNICIIAGDNLSYIYVVYIFPSFIILQIWKTIGRYGNIYMPPHWYNQFSHYYCQVFVSTRNDALNDLHWTKIITPVFLEAWG